MYTWNDFPEIMQFRTQCESRLHNNLSLWSIPGNVYERMDNYSLIVLENLESDDDNLLSYWNTEGDYDNRTLMIGYSSNDYYTTRRTRLINFGQEINYQYLWPTLDYFVYSAISIDVRFTEYYVELWT